MKFNAIPAEILRRVGLIRKADGYASDVGAHVFLGPRQLGAGEVPGAVLYESDPVVNDQSGEKTPMCRVRMEYVLEATSTAVQDAHQTTGHLIAADLCRVLWPEADGAKGSYFVGLLTDPPLYGGHQVLPRADGQYLVTVQLKFSCLFLFYPGHPSANHLQE